MLKIPLFYWNGEKNFGDELSHSVVEWISKCAVHRVDETARNKLLAAGSILEHARNGDVVWGSGIHPSRYDAFWRPQQRNWYKRRIVVDREISVLAVRGPLSRDALLYRDIPCSERYGDPGILTPLIYPREHNPVRKVGLIPHFRDKALFKRNDLHIIDVAMDWKAVVDEIVRCECVVSSSLHGVIVAEAYGVPAIWLRTLNGEGFVKYVDYYLATGRSPTPRYSIDEALRFPIPSVPMLKDMQSSLIQCFDRERILELATKRRQQNVA